MHDSYGVALHREVHYQFRIVGNFNNAFLLTLGTLYQGKLKIMTSNRAKHKVVILLKASILLLLSTKRAKCSVLEKWSNGSAIWLNLAQVVSWGN